LADAAAADVFGFSFLGFLASRFPFGMAAAPSSGLSVAPVGEITSLRPLVAKLAAAKMVRLQEIGAKGEGGAVH
jgi:hypothetical protein